MHVLYLYTIIIVYKSEVFAKIFFFNEWGMNDILCVYMYNVTYMYVYVLLVFGMQHLKVHVHISTCV